MAQPQVPATTSYTRGFLRITNSADALTYLGAGGGGAGTNGVTTNTPNQIIYQRPSITNGADFGGTNTYYGIARHFPTNIYTTTNTYSFTNNKPYLAGAIGSFAGMRPGYSILFSNSNFQPEIYGFNNNNPALATIANIISWPTYTSNNYQPLWVSPNTDEYYDITSLFISAIDGGGQFLVPVWYNQGLVLLDTTPTNSFALRTQTSDMDGNICLNIDAPLRLNGFGIVTIAAAAHYNSLVIHSNGDVSDEIGNIKADAGGLFAATTVTATNGFVYPNATTNRPAVWSGTNLASAPAATDGFIYIADSATAGGMKGTNLVPTGIIVMWSGTIASIPSGWALCNGSSGTPDLRNRFVVCANADSGGVAKSTVTGSAQQSANPTHTHSSGSITVSLAGGADFNTVAANDSYTISGTTGATTAGTGANATIPTFYALAYIMKL